MHENFALFHENYASVLKKVLIVIILFFTISILLIATI